MKGRARNSRRASALDVAALACGHGWRLSSLRVQPDAFRRGSCAPHLRVGRGSASHHHWFEESEKRVFKTKAEKTSSGNFNIQATCPKGHTCFKKAGDRNPYECPYCGHEVP